MASFEVILKPSVEKDFLSLPKPVVGRVLNRIEELKANPFPPQSSKLQGAEHLYRIRVGDYPIVYKVDSTAKVVLVQHVRHRREVYRGL